MVLGTVVAVAQSNLKRMLAYSSIAHAGYLLVGLVAANEIGKSAILFYLLSYAVVNLGAFAAIALLGTREHANDDLASFAGLSNRHPVLAAAHVRVPAVARRPAADGRASWRSGTSSAPRCSRGYYALAIIGVLTSVISVFFYLRVIVMMYMARNAAEVPAPAAVARAVARSPCRCSRPSTSASCRPG